MRLSFLTVTMMTVLMISGCSLSPEYTRPVSPAPLAWNQHDISFDGNEATHASDPFFSDSKIQQLLKLTMDGNKDLQVSALNLKKAGAQYGVDRLSYFPNVSLTAEKTAAHEPAGIFDTVDTGAVTYHQYDVKLVSASWEVDFWGRLRSLRDASLNEYLAADASSRALRLSLMEQSVSTYLAYLADREAVEVARAILENKLVQKDMSRKAMQAGELSQDAVIDAEKDAGRAEAELARLRLQAQQDYNALQLIVGRPLPASLFTGVTLDQDWHFPSLKSGLPSDVLLRRPDIVAAEYELKAANARIGAARAAFFPSVSITAAGGSSSAELGDLLSGGTANWSFVPSVNLPLFDGGKNRANLSIAELNKNIEIVNYQKAIQQAFRDVSDALAGQASIKQQYEQSESVYAASLKQYQMAQATWTAGQISRENLIQKKNELLELQKQMLSARLKYLVQSVKLFSVMGGDNTI
ncbi:efflux transporter outer membrane subunit [Enterobacter sp. DTU_2021_1002640_1_SI_PRY_ASU_LCPMC_013]|uniref:efflux transporter outer membrane subunit n=1 Tax=Enterobacter sp. DTU_2021_1002640_1_SI_PRY_ASU_LCPMC_013 TaxID=3077940 RepID=UPI0028EF17DB|nr:efflux transporter outer membrane subunit [Enterobacter sp. DTU_2021_1002640_1_SI_PRY_ASU_LCPMC_013]WNU99166.1 efflux transporter outer membrane subunit [Enterobacter sp. DTU_2021_1002640_1_SI_PRY_ASU_LCPMC_013]